MLPVRHTVLFPFAILPLNVGRERSVALLNAVMAGDRTIAVLAQKDGGVEDPGFSDLYETGTLGTVLRMVRFPDERYSVLVQGVERVRVLQPVADQPYLKARFPSVDAWQISATGRKDYVTAEGIRVCPAPVLLGTLA